MIRRTTQPLAVWFLTCDLALTALAWIGAYRLRFSGWFPVTKTPPDFALCLSNLPLVVLLAVVAYRLAGQYLVHRLRRFREEMVAVAKGAALLSLLVMASTFYTHNGFFLLKMALFLAVFVLELRPMAMALDLVGVYVLGHGDEVRGLRGLASGPRDAALPVHDRVRGELA